jgi:hypothetical protein
MLETLKSAILITCFVFIMMLLIEYINVLTRGAWQQKITQRSWSQYILTALLGSMPGCLGAFAVVTMYSHGIVSIGAVVTAMIATSGDEAFVLIATVPLKALIITAALFSWGIIIGVLTDIVMGRKGSRSNAACESLSLHEEETCICLPRGQLLHQWKRCTPTRGILTLILLIIMFMVAIGQIGPSSWDWIRISILFVSAIALFIVSTVPDHFLDKHLWKHVMIRHVPRIFLWTLGTLLALYFLTEYLNIDLRYTIQKGRWITLAVAALIGLIPESGPHLIFVTLYAQGIIPFSILLANSAVQDGHGMLPLLAYSKSSFLKIKFINLLAGLFIGVVTLGMGL